MTEMTATVLDHYYDVLGGGWDSSSEQRLREILVEQLVFEGPAGRRVGAEGFIAGVRGFVETVSQVTFLARVASDGRAAALYDAALPGGTIRFAEFLELSDRRIGGIHLLFDVVAYRAHGGR